MFFFNKPKRTVVKAISYRCLGSTQTVIISLLVTGSLPKSLMISAAEVCSKIFFYYVHEQIWERK